MPPGFVEGVVQSDRFKTFLRHVFFFYRSPFARAFICVCVCVMRAPAFEGKNITSSTKEKIGIFDGKKVNSSPHLYLLPLYLSGYIYAHT